MGGWGRREGGGRGGGGREERLVWVEGDMDGERVDDGVVMEVEEMGGVGWGVLVEGDGGIWMGRWWMMVWLWRWRWLGWVGEGG